MHSPYTIEYLRIIQETIDVDAFIDDDGRVCYTDMTPDGAPFFVTVTPEEAYKELLAISEGC